MVTIMFVCLFVRYLVCMARSRWGTGMQGCAVSEEVNECVSESNE